MTIYHKCTNRRKPDEQFPEQWLGRRGSSSWSHTSPDLRKVYYFLRGYVINAMCKIPITTREDNKNKNKVVLQNMFLRLETWVGHFKIGYNTV